MTKDADICVVDLFDRKVIKATEGQTPLNRKNSNLVEAIQEAKKRVAMYKMLEKKQEKELQERYGIDPKVCYNHVCENNKEGMCDCTPGRPVWCLYRMTDPPPNSLDYDEYMPSHQEALDRLEANGLLKGERQRYLEECAQYQRPTTQAERGQHVINGVTMDQFQQALLNCLERLRERTPPFDIRDDDDRWILANNVTVEMEKVLGIYPNICRLK